MTRLAVLLRDGGDVRDPWLSGAGVMAFGAAVQGVERAARQRRSNFSRVLGGEGPVS